MSIVSADRKDLSDLQRLTRTRGAPQSLNVSHFERALADQCALLSRHDGALQSVGVLDLDSGSLLGVFVDPAARGRGLGRQMLNAIERLAVQFGMWSLAAPDNGAAAPFLTACGYQRHPDGWHRSLARRQTRYGRRIARLGKDCAIPEDYGRRHRLRLQEEANELATVAVEPNGREHQLKPDTALAWLAMQHAASEDGVEIQPASAFRSVGYQASIIQAKRQRGQDTAQILSVSAAPGYSEHHTGRAIDIRTPGSPPLETEFEDTEAFEWLLGSAENFGFRLSYPRDNRHGILYEPWHWFHHPGGSANRFLDF